MSTNLRQFLTNREEEQSAGQKPADKLPTYIRNQIENKPNPTYIGPAKSNFGRALMRGTDNTQATGYAAVESLAELFGSEAVEEWARDGVRKNLNAAAANPMAIESTDDINSLGDLGTFVLESLGEALPGIAVMAGTGGTAGLIARATLGKTVAGQITKAAAKRTVQKVTERGALAGAIPQLAGETRISNPEATFNELAVTTLGKSALEMGPIGKVVGKLFQRTDLPESIGQIMKRAPRDMASLGMAEGIVEGGQQFLDQALDSYIHESELFNDENWKEIYESAARGAAAGGALGGLTTPFTGSASGARGQRPDDRDSSAEPSPTAGGSPPGLPNIRSVLDGEFVGGEQRARVGQSPQQGQTIDGQATQIFEGQVEPDLTGPTEQRPAVTRQGDTFEGELSDPLGISAENPQAPAPSTPRENQFSANAFLDNRQQAYIQTPGEELPANVQKALANKEVVQQEITESADPQLVGSKVYTRPADAADAMYKLRNEGAGELQAYGTKNKPALEDVDQIFIPIDKDGNHGSPVLTTADEQEQLSVRTALNNRVGTDGSVVRVKATPERLKEIVEDRQAKQGLVKSRREAFQQRADQEQTPEFEFIGQENVHSTARGIGYNSRTRNDQVKAFDSKEQSDQVVEQLRSQYPDRGFESVQVSGKYYATVTEQPDANTTEGTGNTEAQYFGRSEIFEDAKNNNSLQYRSFEPSDTVKLTESKPFKTREDAKQEADFFGRMEPNKRFSVVGNETSGFFVEVLPLRNEYAGQEQVKTKRPLTNQERAQKAEERDITQEDTYVESLGRYVTQDNPGLESESAVADAAYRRAKRKLGDKPDPRAKGDPQRFFQFTDKNGDRQSVNLVQFTNSMADTIESTGTFTPEQRLRAGFSRVVDYISQQSNTPRKVVKELTQGDYKIGTINFQKKDKETGTNQDSKFTVWNKKKPRKKEDKTKVANRLRDKQISEIKKQLENESIHDSSSVLRGVLEDNGYDVSDYSDTVVREVGIQFLEQRATSNQRRDVIGQLDMLATAKYETNEVYEGTDTPVEEIVTGAKGKFRVDENNIESRLRDSKLNDFGTHKVSESFAPAIGEFLQRAFEQLSLKGNVRVLTPKEADALRGINSELDKALDSMKKGTRNKGAFVPMGYTGIVILKPGLTQSQAVLTLGHEIGHMLYDGFMKSFATYDNPHYQDMVNEYRDTKPGKPFEEWVSDKVAAALRDSTTDSRFAPLKSALMRLVNMLKRVMPEQFSRSVPVDRFLRYVVKQGRANRNPYMHFGHSAFKNMSADTVMGRLKKFRSSVTGEKLNKVYGEASAFVGFLDSFNRRIVGEQFANIFKTRSQSQDRVQTTTHRAARKKFTPGMKVKNGELVWHKGQIYASVVDGTLQQTVLDSVQKGQLGKISRKDLMQKHTEKTGWLDAKNHQFAMWSRAFTDLMPKDNNQWDTWLVDNVINPAKPEAKFADTMNRFWTYMNERMGGKLGQLEDFRLPRVYNVDVLMQDPQAFKDVLRQYLTDPNGNPLKSPRMDDVVNNIYNSIVENNGVDIGQVFQDTTVQSVGFNRKGRTLKDIPDRVLEQFMAPPKTRLLQYVKAGTSRAELESRAGGYSGITNLYEKLKRERGRGQHIDQEYFASIHGINKEYMEKAAPWAKQDMDLQRRKNEILAEIEKGDTPQLQTRLAGVNKQITEHDKRKPNEPQYWDPMQRVDTLVDQLPAERRSQVRKVVDGMLGRAGLDMPVPARKVQQYLMTLQYMTTLLFAVPASLSDFGNIMIRTKEFSQLGTNLKRIVQSARDFKELESLARSMGLAQHDAIINIILSSYGDMYMDPKVQKMNETFFKMTGLEWYTKTTRIVAMNLGMGFIEDHAIRAKAGDKRSQRYLNELNLKVKDVEEWLRRGRPMQSQSTNSDNPVNKVLSGIDAFVNESVLRPDAAQRPSWANDMRFQLIWQLKSFFYAFGHNILGGIYREMESRYGETGKLNLNTVAPALLGAVTLMPLASLGLSVRETIKHGFEEDPTEAMSFMEYMYEVFDRAGGLGPFSLIQGMFDAENFGGSGVVSLLGPTASHVETFLDRGFMGGIKRAIPVHNQLNGSAFGIDYMARDIQDAD